MKPSRPKKSVTLSDVSANAEGWSGFLSRHLNTLSTVILLILAGVMFVRWRMKVAENAKILIATDLSNAQTQVGKLRNGQFPQAGSPADLIKAIQETETQASGGLSNVINSSDADEQMKAEAFVLRGDMYWYLANLPPLPGSDSEPTLRLTESTDTLLGKATDSYQQVIATFPNQHEQIDTAHLGLAAIAENRGDWTTAEKELKSVVDDTNAIAVLAQQARFQLLELPTLKQPVYVVPPSGIATSQPSTTMPTTEPAKTLTFGPFLPAGATTQPTTVPADALESIIKKIGSTTKPAGH
jgi:hypothetical protein